MANMGIWNAVKTPPADALKKIKGGRLKGMSDISPQWRYEIMTETFGMCGFGWKYTIDKTWCEPGENGEICAFASVSVFVKVDNEWSAAIPATGGSQLVEKEKSGMYTNDEAYKMAITDALGTAMKMLGVASDVYRGRCETKYEAPADDSDPLADDAPLPPEPPKAAPPKAGAFNMAEFKKYADSKKVNQDTLKAWLKKEFKADYDKGMTLVQIIEKHEARIRAEIETGMISLPF